MIVVGVLVDDFVGMRMRVQRVRTNEMRTRHHVPQMTIDCIDKEQFPLRVPVMPPGVRGAGSDGVKDSPFGMIAPHPTPYWNSLLCGCPRKTYVTRSRRAAAAV